MEAVSNAGNLANASGGAANVIGVTLAKVMAVTRDSPGRKR
jgi:hypothetical protein